MVEKTLEKEIELREWQKMFNPSKVDTQSSVILREKPKNREEKTKNSPEYFCW